jgi:dTDP-4-dehydrorhamnose reductase
MAKKKGPILVLGAGGLLGRAVVAASTGPTLTAGRADLQSKSADDVAALVARAEPSIVINCAADVDAEGAERDISRAMAANAELPGRVAAACRLAGARMVQVSSTGCYGAWKDEPYTEDDDLYPTTAHHRTKVMGEEAVRSATSDHLIARVGWLYGGGADNPRNFVWRRLLEARSTPRLQSDVDQKGCPSNVADVARQLLLAIDHGVQGTVNMVTQGCASRFDYVTRIVQASGFDCEVLPAPAFARTAPVSHNETAINMRLKQNTIDIMPNWAVAIDDYVAALRSDRLWNQFEGSPT